MSELKDEARALRDRLLDLVQQARDIRRQAREIMRQITESRATGDGSSDSGYIPADAGTTK
jgi:uncharacterized coiled-coil DUF342 family protein